MNTAKGFVFIAAFLAVSGLFSQQPKTDSLRSALHSSPEDTNKINLCLKLLDAWVSVNSDSAIYFGKTGIRLAEKLNSPRHAATLENAVGQVYYTMSNYSLAMKYYNAALARTKIHHLNKITGSLYNNIGNVYYTMGNYELALEFYRKNAEIKKQLKDYSGLASVTGNIGMIFNRLQESDKAMEYYLQAYTIGKEHGNKRVMASALNNMGTVFFGEKNFSKSLDYYLQALKIREELGEKSLMANSYSNIGGAYAELQKPDSAYYYHFRALQINSQLQSKRGVALSKINMGIVLLHQKRYAGAEKVLKESAEISRELGLYELEDQAQQELVNLYKTQNRYADALAHLERANICKDSIALNTQKLEINRKEMQLEFQKQQEIDSVKTAEKLKTEKLRHDEEVRRQSLYTYAGITGFALALLIALISYRAYRQKKRDSETIAAQKKLVEEKQKDIIDSIHYAKRIQNSLIPGEKYIERQIQRLKDECSQS
ncbi:MAG: tetratricopeptide repeat protein [Bacteroidia bacterium]|nr:tetratricopeptide repeat protein [Bacteroidia bacterium]